MSDQSSPEETRRIFDPSMPALRLRLQRYAVANGFARTALWDAYVLAFVDVIDQLPPELTGSVKLDNPFDVNALAQVIADGKCD